MGRVRTEPKSTHAGKEYQVKRKLQDQGGSLLVSLPKIWVDAERLKAGDEVVIKFDSYLGLVILPAVEQVAGSSK